MVDVERERRGGVLWRGTGEARRGVPGVCSRRGVEQKTGGGEGVCVCREPAVSRPMKLVGRRAQTGAMRRDDAGVLPRSRPLFGRKRRAKRSLLHTPHTLLFCAPLRARTAPPPLGPHTAWTHRYACVPAHGGGACPRASVAVRGVAPRRRPGHALPLRLRPRAHSHPRAAPHRDPRGLPARDRGRPRHRPRAVGGSPSSPSRGARWARRSLATRLCFVRPRAPTPPPPATPPPHPRTPGVCTRLP